MTPLAGKTHHLMSAGSRNAPAKKAQNSTGASEETTFSIATPSSFILSGLAAERLQVIAAVMQITSSP